MCKKLNCLDLVGVGKGTTPLRSYGIFEVGYPIVIVISHVNVTPSLNSENND
jgi:hypothetical protein